MPDLKYFFIETFGCQMNFADSEIVASLLAADRFQFTKDKSETDIYFINTCSVRDNAEQRVAKRLSELKAMKKKKPQLLIAVIGCMAERLKEKLAEEHIIVDIIAGPDSYRKLPLLIREAAEGKLAVDTYLSEEETYSNINPMHYSNNKVSAFIPIMRGCNNFCSYCVVPYTRGRERSRDAHSIIDEAKKLFDQGFKEITLLGQNVNSYNSLFEGTNTDFVLLLEKLAVISPLLRLRFTTSHPKDISERLIRVISENDNICRSIHLPIQSGNDFILKRMNRGYTRKDYLEKIELIKKYIPSCSLSTDIIVGFCGETEEAHNDTLSLMERVGYDYAFMFKYSERPDTFAANKYKDDVPDEIKTRRLEEIIALQQKLSLSGNRRDIGKTFSVLIENYSKRSKDFFTGRNSQNKVVVFPVPVHSSQSKDNSPNFIVNSPQSKDNSLKQILKIGDYCEVLVKRCSSATLFGEIV
ncbi:MAG: tRNA (N6-isopentenyl adenosine(37)-C2)-methylthiotransferase MiaB [Bacteroidales bacterium]|nr:tRNA (N6-isopentenyl adenosine(37)-C2)-methylthiotransferase MiaB [Bacteroidales bacterium]